jgi:hypothetical protein
VHLALVALALTSVAPLRAQAIDEKNVISGKAALDPGKGYIFVRSGARSAGTFLRVPDDATRAEYQQDWEKALVKAQKRYKNQLQDWRFDAMLAEKNKQPVPEKPEAPTRQNFTIASIEARDAVSFGPMFAYAKGESAVSYLTAVKPGTYIWYGPLVQIPAGGASGTCFCMGTIRFEVKPGTITNLGDYLFVAPRTTESLDVLTREGLAKVREKAERDAGGPVEVISNTAAPSYELPDSLKAWPATRANFQAHGKLNNFFGVYVSRIAPIEGVIAYRRDKVIDVRTNADLSSPPMVTQVRIKK